MTLWTESSPKPRTDASGGASGGLRDPADPVALARAVARAQSGEVEAFEMLYRACVGRVYAVCLRMHGGRVEDAEDTVQEAFVQAWKQLPRFRGESGFATWLHRIAVNAALDRIRAERSRGGGAPRHSVDAAERLPGRAHSPGTVLDLERAITGLPERARLAFVLHDVEGFKHREIAEMTGTAEGTWKGQLHRARRLLQEALER